MKFIIDFLSKLFFSNVIIDEESTTEKYAKALLRNKERQNRDFDTFFEVETNIKKSKHYKIFIKPTPKKVPFSTINGQSYYMHTADVTGLFSEEEALKFATNKVNRATILCKFDEENKQRKVSAKDRLNLVQNYNKLMFKETQPQNKWEDAFKNKIMSYTDNSEEEFKFMSPSSTLKLMEPSSKKVIEIRLPKRKRLGKEAQWRDYF